MKRSKNLLLILLSSLVLSGCSIFDFVDNFTASIFGPNTEEEQSGEPLAPQGNVSLSLDKYNATLEYGQTLLITPTLVNSTSNILWTSTDSNIATVDGGLVTAVDSSENVGKTVTIRATLADNHQISATCNITIKGPTVRYKYTVMYYMCASSLEYDSSYQTGGSRAQTVQPALFTKDIKEILSVKNVPDDVKIIIQTGGSKKWSGDLGISSTKLQRYEVVNQELRLIDTLSHNQMAKKESFESFLKWGLNDYPADQMGVILSGHGCGIGGCLPDDNYSYSEGMYSFPNVLSTQEIAQASKDALASSDREKFTWIGYDACLMGCADIATINADYYDYMVASQEAEEGEGWDHDVWLKSIVSNPSISPEVLLPKITESFVASYHKNTEYFACYQTLAAYDLKKIGNLVNAFNNYVDSLSVTTTTRYNRLKLAFSDSLKFGVDEGDYLYGLVDFSDYLSKIDSRFSSDSSEVKAAIQQCVISNKYCSKYSISPCGMSAFLAYPIERATGRNAYGLQASINDYSGELATKFTSWQTIVLQYGNFNY